MHVSVEILGGYDEAKLLLQNKTKTIFIPEYGWHLELDRYNLSDILLDYRKTHGFYELGDVAVFIAEEKPNAVFKVVAIDGQSVDLTTLDSNTVEYKSVSIADLRHAEVGEHFKKKRA